MNSFINQVRSDKKFYNEGAMVGNFKMDIGTVWNNTGTINNNEVYN